MTQFARFVYGPAAGQVLEVEGDRHQVADIPTLPSMDPAIEQADVVDIPVTTYEVHEFRYASGHHHFYAAPYGVSPVGLFNAIWYGYQKTQSLRNQVTELEEENRRLERELWREKFLRNQFGRYPT
jgi:hypothetical protein